jgi:hypothetical protein
VTPIWFPEPVVVKDTTAPVTSAPPFAADSVMLPFTPVRFTFPAEETAPLLKRMPALPAAPGQST